MKEMAHGTTPDDVLAAYAKGCSEVLDWCLAMGAIEGERSITQPQTKETADKINSEYHEYEHSYSFGYFAVGKKKDVEIKGPNHTRNCARPPS